MRIMRYYSYYIITVVLCLFVTGMASAQVVTFNVAEKKAVSDTDKIDPVGARVIDDQAGVFVQNVILEPQNYILKYSGIKDQNYDLYVNNEFIGTKNKSELENGIEMKLEGCIVDPDLMRCIKALENKIEKEYQPWQGRFGEIGRAVGTLSQAAEWMRSSNKSEQAYRSAGVIIAPSGTPLKPMRWLTRMDANETIDVAKRSCERLQVARSRMSSVIKDPIIRNWAVVTMTPVEFSAVLSIKDGKPYIDATVLNNCNLPISGSIAVKLPDGWQSDAKNLEFKDLKSGDKYNISFSLISLTTNAEVPEKVPMTASVVIKQDEYTAECYFETSAKAADEAAE